MAQTLPKSRVFDDALLYVREGMPVFDRDNAKVGAVTLVFMGSDSDDDTLTLSDMPQDIQNMPREIALRLVDSGFVEINTGLIRGRRYASADQIAHITDEGVWLKIWEDGLF